MGTEKDFLLVIAFKVEFNIIISILVCLNVKLYNLLDFYAIVFLYSLLHLFINIFGFNFLLKISCTLCETLHINGYKYRIENERSRKRKQWNESKSYRYLRISN